MGADILEHGHENYLILTDYFSSYFEINKLTTMTSTNVINICKSHFYSYGIPDVLVSDCGTQFTSELFGNFSKEWCFVHVKSSPHHHQSNGKAEAAVKTAKKILVRSAESGQDYRLALLEWRNTPSGGFDSSPVQRFMCRRTKTSLTLN